MKNKLSYIYLDYAAATPVWSEVKAVAELSLDDFGNTGSLHSVGQKAKTAFEQAKQSIAHQLACKQEELIITSGATESNNLAILGVIDNFCQQYNLRPKLIVSAIEHPSVLEPAQALKNKVDLHYLPVNKRGIVEFKYLDKLLENDVPTLISIMSANNEIGSIQPIHRLAKLIKTIRSKHHFPILLHSDAAQLAAWRQIAVNNYGVDLLTISGAKIGGGHGTGLLFKKQGVKIEPQIHGGGQQNNLRSGTINVLAAQILAAALEKTWTILPQKSGEISKLKEDLATKLLSRIPGSSRNDSTEGLPNILSLTIKDINAEDLIYQADAARIEISAGSACSTMEKDHASHVLEALGLSPDDSNSTIRISLGWQTTASDIKQATKILPQLVETQRKDRPFINKIEKIGKKLAKKYAKS